MPLDAELLISVGELSVRKNHKVVVDALQELPNHYWYIIVGKGDLKDELEKIDHTGRLRLLGFRTDIVELLRCSDVFVFPSLQEGLPVALMEAMASGMPVVCSNIRGNKDLIVDGIGGYFCKNNDVIGFSAKIRSIDYDKKMKMYKTNLLVIEHFDIKSINSKMSEIYTLDI